MAALQGSSAADATLGGKERRERSKSKGRKEGKVKEKDKEKNKDRDRHKEKKSKDKDNDKEKEKDRVREHEKEKHKEKHREKDRDKGRDKDKSDKDRDRERERDRGSGAGRVVLASSASLRKPDINDSSRRMMREAMARADERGEKSERRDKRRRRSSSNSSSRGRHDRQLDGGEAAEVAKDSPDSAKDAVDAKHPQPSSLAADAPSLPPFAPGTPEAERLAAARAEISRLATVGQPPPQWLATQVAYGIQAQAQAEAHMRVQEQAKVKAARQETLDKAKKVAKPPPWAAVAAIFQKGKTPSSSTARADGSAETAGAVESTKVRERPSLAMLSELQKSIAEERNKLRLFVIKAKQDFEERKERASVAGQRIGVTDEEEYYTASVGEQFGPERCYRVEGAVGRGVFSSVFKCRGQDNKEYAVKFIRSNSMMRRVAEKEVETYKRLATQARKKDAEGARHLINLSGCQTFEHMGHLCFVFDLLRCDMRAALQKYGQGGGLPIVTLAQYLRQIFLGLRALRKIQVIHTDLKPDNILMTMNKAEVQICDFGSAFEVSEQVCTSYCQPRYYRAPEIMLGLRYDTQVDVWSMGTTIFELATGKILFTGKTNNQMLRQFIEVCGRFPQKMMAEGEFSKKHFKANGDFLNKDPYSLTGMVDTWSFHKQAPERPVLGLLQAQLTTPGKGVDKATHDRWVVQLAELISRCLTPDMDERLLPEQVLELAFFSKER